MSDTNISDEAVEQATGRNWSEWFATLDEWGAAEAGHRQTAKHLFDEHGLSGWWSQMVTVEYERERGLRDVGETTSGFQMGKRKTFAPSVKRAWELIVSDDGQRIWLGEPIDLSEGVTYELPDGTTGEVRVVAPGSHLRLTWQPPQWEEPSTLQVRAVEAKSGKGTIVFHHEKLPNAAAREEMIEHWQATLNALAASE